VISKDTSLTSIVCVICVFAASFSALGQDSTKPDSTIPNDVTTDIVPGTPYGELVKYQEEFSSAHIEPAQMDGKAGIAVIFEGTEDLHYYAKPETATAPGFELKVEAKSDDFAFDQAVFPKWKLFTDPLDKKVEVYVGNFNVFIPIKTAKSPDIKTGKIEVRISGQPCTSEVCLRPIEKTLSSHINLSQSSSWRQISIESADKQPIATEPEYTVWFALSLAFLAGLMLNIMPCVWPVLPLVIMRIVQQAEQSKGKAIAMGMSFCVGILIFFASLATANIILQSFYDTTLGWGDHLRNPLVASALALLMIVMALFMFGVFTITVPASISSKSGSGKGYVGSVGMGFLAAILSTPCSFGILAVAFVWAQTQSPLLATTTMMVIGLGMAAPYAILTSMPALLKRLPKAGRWMEIFKQALGFILLIIAVKMIKAVPKDSRIDLAYFAVVLSFCVWMWGSWVSFGSTLSRKLIIRAIAVVIIIAAWFFFFTPERIDWNEYDAGLIKTAQAQKRPVLIKFTADWCTNCEIVDKVVYKRKDIAELIEQKHVLAIKADTTSINHPATLALANIYHEPGVVPLNILNIPGKEKPIKWHGIFFADELKKSLQELTYNEKNGKKSKD